MTGKPVAVAGGETDKSGSPRGVDVGRPLVPAMFESVLAGFNPTRMRQGHRSRWGVRANAVYGIGEWDLTWAGDLIRGSETTTSSGNI